MAVLTVGAGQQFTTLASAIAASQNGDTIDVEAGTYTNDFAEITTNITIQGVGGMVNLVATQAPPNGNAILVTDSNVTINDVAFSGATVADGNGAGIRYQSGNLVLNNDYFYDNQDGLLAASNPQGSITINNSEFNDNGTGDGYTHNLYVNEVGTLTIDNSLFTDAVVGHEIKSRADTTIIENSRIIDGPTGTASYSIDLPNGGNAIIENNVVEQGPLSQNAVIIAYGEEGGVYAGSSLQISGNTVLNDLASSSSRLLWNETTATAAITNNQIYGLTAAQISNGPSTQSGNTLLAIEPALNLSPPYLRSAVAPLDFTGNGTSDILWRNATTNDTGIDLIGNGAVTGWSDLGTISSTWSVLAVGNFSGTGVADILWRNSTTDETGIDLMGNGAVTGWSDLGVISSSWSVAGIGDFNGNGTTDTLWRNSATGDTGIDLMGRGAVTGWSDLGVISSAWSVVGTGDFTGDGITDILWRNSISGETGIDLMGSNGAVTGWTDLGVISSAWSVAGIGAYTGGTAADILWRNSASGDTGVDVFGNGQLTGWSNLGNTSGWSVLGSGDFTGNGISDILWRNAQTGETGIDLLSSSGAVTAWSDLGIINSSWSVQQIGDFNGDGTSDVLWRNTSGSTGIDLMAHGAVSGWTSLGTIGSAWSVVTNPTLGST
jgi:hypothetical protein